MVHLCLIGVVLMPQILLSSCQKAKKHSLQGCDLDLPAYFNHQVPSTILATDSLSGTELKEHFRSLSGNDPIFDVLFINGWKYHWRIRKVEKEQGLYPVMISSPMVEELVITSNGHLPSHFVEEERKQDERSLVQLDMLRALLEGEDGLYCHFGAPLGAWATRNERSARERHAELSALSSRSTAQSDEKERLERNYPVVRMARTTTEQQTHIMDLLTGYRWAFHCDLVIQCSSLDGSEPFTIVMFHSKQ